MSVNDQFSERPRAADLGPNIGLLPRGANNAITDVPRVSVGHITLIDGEGPLDIGHGPVRTGVTVILPHDGNIFREKVTAAVHVLNGFGKSVGFPQVAELGRIETPIALTSTLSTWRVADALIDYLSQENPGVYSFNPIVGECNDSYLNDIVGRHVTAEHVFQAIGGATSPNAQEGVVGAGTGMTGFGWKGGIGTSSRLCELNAGEFTVGVMTLTNTGDARELRMDGVQIGRKLLPSDMMDDRGSIMMVVATDAPLSSRQLGRVGRHAGMGLARAGGIAGHGSGDFIIAFSNATEHADIEEEELTSLFRGVVESTEEAVINSVLRAETVVGRDGNTRHGIPVERVSEILKEHGVV